MEGGYAYIDSSHPRRPSDFARLSSMEFEATGAETLKITYCFLRKEHSTFSSRNVVLTD
jgi:hypothetical protein